MIVDGVIVAAKRVANSREGNPRVSVEFASGHVYLTETDSQVGFVIENHTGHAVAVDVERGRITRVRCRECGLDQ